MSCLQATQLEACEKDLAGLPAHCLFDREATDLDAEVFFDQSFYAAEEKTPKLHTVAELREAVLQNFPKELVLLSRDERELLGRAIVQGGTVHLMDPSEILPTRNLVRRLWARVEKVPYGMHLILPPELMTAAFLLLATPDYEQNREIVERVADSVDDTLYLLGAARMNTPFQHLSALLRDTSVGECPALVRRMFLAEFDYIHASRGQILLIHPGLADPDLLSPEALQSAGLFSMGEEDLARALKSLEAIEDPLYERMLALLDGATRPELVTENVIEDLIILAKQDVPLSDMREVLTNSLITYPSPEMLSTLREMHDRIPRWLYLNASRVQ